MNPPIKILPDNLINQIAAGEVVERPASVINELLENAVDAAADRITVEVLQAGREKIRITDNGRGMTREDLALAVRRHATSKIDRFSDLYSLKTMGFRGEALPSIGAVSRLSLTSVLPGAVSGWRLDLRGGEQTGLQEVAGTPGTVVEVDDLFYNTPARQAFLKSPRAEWNQVQLAFERVALGFPEIELALFHNGKTVLRLFPDSGMDLRLKDLWGGERTIDLIPVAGEELHIRVSGFIAPPHLHANTARYLSFLVNRRWVRSPLLYPLLLRSYEGLLAPGRFPIAFLSLEVSPELVDVNIHPTKQEVRFSQGEWVGRVVAKALSQALKGNAAPWTPPAFGRRKPDSASLTGSSLSLLEPAVPYGETFRETFPAGVGPEEGPGEKAWIAPGPEATAAGEPGSAGPFSRLVLIGQVHQTYILAWSGEGLVLLDQHAAHERILYEKFLSRRAQEKAPAQMLLLPVLLELPPLPEEAAEELRESLEALGVEIAPAGGRSFWLRATPPELNPDQTIQAVLERAEALIAGPSAANPEENIQALIRSLACHGAIRAGQALGMEEMRSLLRQLDQTESPSHCPHGRPLWFLLSLAEIEKRFKRK
jgi:DNA mismatch repair protein MutL